ncbi:helix-turn-helix domain-containing protein, partial [Streptomyces sp. NPDC127084]|uniref:helix-turn-helix domain-containing protein n=1 Tax=Streptomyces sp. NPDC127084 TaxID=3347133 RepID=UPI00364A0824
MGEQPYGHGTDAPAESPPQADPPKPHFPAQLRRLRQERGLSLSELSRLTHYSKGYLSKIETGAKRATIDVARRCDQVLRADGELLALLPDQASQDGGPGAGATAPGTRAGDAACPYRGLPAFTSREAEWFFGRERVTAALVERVFERIGHGPLMLVAPSGAGKSSLLNAGLVPALRRAGGFPMPGAETWPVLGFTPTAHPVEELLARTAKALGSDPGLTVSEVTERPERLMEAVRALSYGTRAGSEQHRPTPPVPRVLLVDEVVVLVSLLAEEVEGRAGV